MSGIDANTSLVLHCDGTDASTSFPDSSLTPKTVTANGAAQVDTAQSVFGGASYLGNATDAYLSSADNAAFEFGSGDFTIDLRVRFNSIPGATANYFFVTKWTTAGAQRCFYFGYHGTDGLVFRYSTDGSTSTLLNNNLFTPSTGTWYHIAVVRNGGNFYWFVDGTQVGGTDSISGTLFNGSAALNIAAFNAGSGGWFDGWMDEIRLSNVARWTASFTPPTSAYAAIATYELDAQPGTYAVTGSAASVVAGRAANAASGSYAISGSAASLVAGFAIDASPGSYAETGADAGFVAAHALDALPGSFTVTGSAATVAAAYAVAASAGSYAVTGADASFLSTRAVLADPGVFTVTGTAATVAAARNMAVDPGSYAVTGADADVVFQVVGSYTISAQPGVFTVSGADAITAATHTISLTPGTYAVTGIDATFLNSRTLVAGPATYTVTGSAMTGAATRTIDAQPGNVSFTGVSAGIGSLFDVEIDAQPGSVTISGTASLTWVPGRLRNTTRGGRIRWNRAGRITQTKEGAVT